MGAGILSKTEMEIVKNNPNVKHVTEKKIFYKDDFKRHFIEEYTSGKGPTQIFREAGFDTRILGEKRIERAAARWREQLQQI